MSFTSFELFISKDTRINLDENTTEVHFLVVADPGDTVDEIDARDFLADTGSVATLANAPRVEVEISERVNSLLFKGKVTYTANFEEIEDEEDTEPETTSFNTTGGTVHISHGLAVVDTFGAASTELGAALNYDGEKVQGLDITEPAFLYTRTVRKLDSEVTDDYQRLLADLTGKVNDSPVKFFFNRGLKFDGAVGSKIRENASDKDGPVEDLWEITYHFAGRQLINDLVVGPFTIPVKLGWDHVDVDYIDVADTAVNQIVRKPKAVRVIQIAEEGDFSLLGIDI